MSKEAQNMVAETGQQMLAPQLRFPEFRNALGWELTPLSKVLYEHKLKSDGKSQVFSVSVHKGLINQIEHLGRSFSAADTSKYNLVQPHDVVYTKSPTGDFPYGVIKQSRVAHSVIVSPLYGVFRPQNKYLGYLLDAYFESTARTKNYLYSIVKKGAKNTLQITNSTFLSKGIYLPDDEAEQKKIADCLSSLDELIAAQAGKVEALKAHKKGLMQQLFPAEGQTIPALRFPEFRNAPGWKSEALDSLLVSVCNGLSLPQSSTSSKYRVTRIETISDGSINIDRVGYVDTDDDISDYKLNVGDILFSNINSVAHIGKSVRVDRDYDLYHGMNLLRLVAASHSDDKFVFYLLNTDFLRDSFRLRANKAVNQASINQTEIRKTQVTYPGNKIEQQKIADCLSSLDELIAAEASKVEALKAHKKGLMQQLFPTIHEDVA